MSSDSVNAMSPAQQALLLVDYLPIAARVRGSIHSFIHLMIHSGLELMKVDSLVELLRREGFRASRTHLDSAAVRTDASAAHLRRIFSQHCRTIQPKH